MKIGFRNAHRRLKAAVLLTVLYPTIVSTLMFKLYLKPLNPPAYEAIGLLTLIYGFVAFLILKYSQRIRWYLAIWLLFTITYGVFYKIPRWNGYWDILWIVVFGWVIQLFILTLLFLPHENTEYNENGA
jgi:hypothetical protein